MHAIDPRARRDRHRHALTLLLVVLLLAALPPTLAAERKTGGGRVEYLERDGQRIYQDRCASCHMPDGRGLSDGFNGFPPLTGMSPWLATRAGQRYVAYAILYGPYNGVIVGDRFYFGLMPRFRPRLDNQQMVALIRYLAEGLNTPQAGYRPIDVGLVEEARQLTDTIDAVHAERDKLPPR